MGHIILFDEGFFHGAHKHVFEDYPNLNGPGDDHFNDKGTKSIVVLEGVWEFFKDWEFQPDNPSLGMLGPGLYHTVYDSLGSQAKDNISSLREVDSGRSSLSSLLSNIKSEIIKVEEIIERPKRGSGDVSSHFKMRTLGKTEKVPARTKLHG
jgi:hypothetical protein